MANAMQVECNMATRYGNVNRIFNDNYVPIETLLSGVVISALIQGLHGQVYTYKLLDIPKEEFAKCFQQWQQRWVKRVAAEGNYVEDNEC